MLTLLGRIIMTHITYSISSPVWAIKLITG
jgi:hypothetical protein